MVPVQKKSRGTIRKSETRKLQKIRRLKQTNKKRKQRERCKATNDVTENSFSEETVYIQFWLVMSYEFSTANTCFILFWWGEIFSDEER